jgi:hypothetical protein
MNNGGARRRGLARMEATMDQGRKWLAAALGALLLVAGCGFGSGGAGDDPQAVMGEFLEAIRQGNDVKASSLLTTTARQKTKEMEMAVAPPGSDTASFQILAVEIEGDEAQVGTDWTDVDVEGQKRTDRIVWLLRKEEAGWRIHGMATRVLADMPPVILNFEDPADMLVKQRQAEEEIARRESQLEVREKKPADQGGATVR